MGKTIRNYNGDGLKAMRKIAPRKKSNRVDDFYDEDEEMQNYESYQPSNTEDHQSDTD